MKVAIVGGGPAGASLAFLLARDGAEATIFDASHPREKPCGGGLTGKALALLPDAPDDDPLPAREVKHCRFDSGVGPRVDIELSRPMAVCARRELDAWLLRRALGAGARHVAERVVGVDSGGRVRTSTGRAALYDVIVGADGASSLVRRTFLRPTPKERLAMAAGWYAPGDARLEVRFLPGLEGYVWLFPRRDHVGVGICAPLGALPTRELLARLEREVALHYPALGPEPDSGRYAQTVPSPSSDPRSILELGGPGWALVGDAAALCDPITGEGIYPALASARALHETLRADGSTARYPERLLLGVGRELLRAAELADMFYAPGFAQRVVRYGAWSPAIRGVLADLVLGEQGYFGLKRRLLKAGPRFVLEAAWARARRIA